MHAIKYSCKKTVTVTSVVAEKDVEMEEKVVENEEKNNEKEEGEKDQDVEMKSPSPAKEEDEANQEKENLPQENEDTPNSEKVIETTQEIVTWSFESEPPTWAQNFKEIIDKQRQKLRGLKRKREPTEWEKYQLLKWGKQNEVEEIEQGNEDVGTIHDSGAGFMVEYHVVGR